MRRYFAFAGGSYSAAGMSPKLARSILIVCRWMLLSMWISVGVLNPSKCVCTLVAGMVAAYSERPGLLRAVISYSEQHPDPAFRRRALELRERSLAGIEKVILLHAREIKHPKPKKAVRIALQFVSLALKERIRPSDKLGGATLSAEELRVELTRMFLGYLRSS